MCHLVAQSDSLVCTFQQHSRKLDFVLGLTTAKIMERRLQTKAGAFHSTPANEQLARVGLFVRCSSWALLSPFTMRRAPTS